MAREFASRFLPEFKDEVEAACEAARTFDEKWEFYNNIQDALRRKYPWSNVKAWIEDNGGTWAE